MRIPLPFTSRPDPRDNLGAKGFTPRQVAHLLFMRWRVRNKKLNLRIGRC